MRTTDVPGLFLPVRHRLGSAKILGLRRLGRGARILVYRRAPVATRVRTPRRGPNLIRFLTLPPGKNKPATGHLPAAATPRDARRRVAAAAKRVERTFIRIPVGPDRPRPSRSGARSHA